MAKETQGEAMGRRWGGVTALLMEQGLLQSSGIRIKSDVFVHVWVANICAEQAFFFKGRADPRRDFAGWEGCSRCLHLCVP